MGINFLEEFLNVLLHLAEVGLDIARELTTIFILNTIYYLRGTASTFAQFESLIATLFLNITGR